MRTLKKLNPLSANPNSTSPETNAFCSFEFTGANNNMDTSGLSAIEQLKQRNNPSNISTSSSVSNAYGKYAAKAGSVKGFSASPTPNPSPSPSHSHSHSRSHSTSMGMNSNFMEIDDDDATVGTTTPLSVGKKRSPNTRDDDDATEGGSSNDDVIELQDTDDEGGWMEAPSTKAQIAKEKTLAKREAALRKGVEASRKAKAAGKPIPKRQKKNTIDSDDSEEEEEFDDISEGSEEEQDGDSDDDDDDLVDSEGDGLVDTPAKKPRPAKPTKQRVIDHSGKGKGPVRLGNSDKDGFQFYDPADFEGNAAAAGLQERANSAAEDRKRRSESREKSRKETKRIVTSDGSGSEAEAGSRSGSGDDSGSDDNDDDGNASSDDEDEGWMDTFDQDGNVEDLTKAKVKMGADKLISKCKALSGALRKVITTWERGVIAGHGHDSQENNDADADADADTPGNGDDGRGCLSLVAIAPNSTTASTPKNQQASLNNTDTDNDNGTRVLSDTDFPFLSHAGVALKAYQLVGCNWMKLLHENQVNGVLADDMGLGKTVQTVAFMGWLKREMAAKGERSEAPHLVVVPASTLSNWQLELARFDPDLEVWTYHGSQDARYQIRRRYKKAMSKALMHPGGGSHSASGYKITGGSREGTDKHGPCDVLLCTYSVFEREAAKDDQKFLNNQQFSYLVLDEAHCIKNPASQRYVNLSRINSRHRLLLSGTPVQNNLSELLALLSFLMPKVFKRHACDNLLESFSWKTGERADNSSVALLRRMLVPFVLRRIKKDVLDQLTDKKLQLRVLPMETMQGVIYDSIIEGYTKKKTQRKQTALGEKKDELAWGLNNYGSPTHAVENEGNKAAPVDLTGGALSLSIARASNSPAALNKKQETAETASLREDLSNKDMKHLFTALRKAANHPLLLRVHFTDDKVINAITGACMAAEYFGKTCTYERAREELVEKFNDFDLHQLCCEYGHLGGIGKYCLGEEQLFQSPKFMFLRDELPRMIKAGHHILIFSQWTRILDLLELLMETIWYTPPPGASYSSPTKAKRDGSAGSSSSSSARRTIVIDDSDDEESAAPVPVSVPVHVPMAVAGSTVVKQEEPPSSSSLSMSASQGIASASAPAPDSDSDSGSGSGSDSDDGLLAALKQSKKKEKREKKEQEQKRTAEAAKAEVAPIKEVKKEELDMGVNKKEQHEEEAAQEQGVPFVRLDGSTPVSSRQALIDRFNKGDIPVFLLSTKAGGLGINLTKADTVILHDLDFNPENDRQAEDRAHRIGQTRDVTIIKLVTEATVDEDIYTMGERKRELSEAVLQNKGSGKGKAGGDMDDPNVIGNILANTMQRRASSKPLTAGTLVKVALPT